MELDSDEEYAQTSLPRKSPSSHPKAPGAPTSTTSSPSAKELPVPAVSRGRPKGCDAYENLSRADRGPVRSSFATINAFLTAMQYCADVLFPEAMLQLHLLRSGKRKSAHLLTPKEENTLYEEGQELLSEGVHWITQIIQMRRLAENTYKKRTRKKEEAQVVIVGGTSTRPKARRISK